MAHNIRWYSHDGKTANLTDCVIVKRRLAGSIQDTRAYNRSAFIDVKSKDHHLVVPGVNLKLKFWRGNYLLGNL